jgi:hypothetical protein
MHLFRNLFSSAFSILCIMSDNSKTALMESSETVCEHIRYIGSYPQQLVGRRRPFGPPVPTRRC